MATAKVSNQGIQVKHILIAITITVSVILFITSIVLITIGYLNPFGSVGLGILGGGCVVYFSAVLFFCASSIWIKNKYYADETDYKEKLVGRSSEDVTLLKPPALGSSSENPEAGLGKSDNDNPVPLYSVSTVYSLSSSSLIGHETTMPCSWQEEAEALDSDVFSSSLTALQHCGMKSHQRLEPTKRPTEQLIDSYAGQKIKDDHKTQKANKADYNNEKYISNLPRQRTPVVIDSPVIPHVSKEKQVENLLNDVHSAKAKEFNFTTNKDLSDNIQPFPEDMSKTTGATSQHNDFTVHYEKYKSQDKIKNNVKPNIQTADRPGSSDTQSDTSVQHTSTNKQDIRKNVVSVLAGNLDKKHNSNEQKDNNKDRKAIPLQGLSPQNDLDRSADVQASKHVTRGEAPREKILFTKKQVKSDNRTNQ